MIIGLLLLLNFINVGRSILNPKFIVAMTFLLMARTTTLPPSGYNQNFKDSKTGIKQYNNLIIRSEEHCD